MGERRTSVIERILQRVEERVEEWRERDKALKTEAEADRDAIWAEAAERERLLAEAMGEEEARRGSAEEIAKQERVVFVMHSEETTQALEAFASERDRLVRVVPGGGVMASPRGPRPRGHERAVATSERAYRSLLRAYPRGLRDEYGDEMARCFRDLCREELEDGGGLGLAALWAHTLPELLCTALKERSTMLNRNTYRSVVGVALATAFILLIPLLAAPAWTLADFVFAGALIFGTGLTYVLVARKAGNIAYRAAVGVALAAAFLLVWGNAAVGITDSDADLMFLWVPAVGIIGAIIARFQPRGMARAMFATALAQALVAVIALIAGIVPAYNSAFEVLGITGFYVALFVGSALLFRHAARGRTPAGAGPEG